MNPLLPHFTPRTSPMKRFLFVSVTLLPSAFVPAHATTIYSGLQNIPIPTDLVGVYLDIDTGITGFDDNSPPAGWDINPFLGGQGVGNGPAFQPARLGAGNDDTLLRLALDDTIDMNRIFSTGYGGSETHLGSQFVSGQEGYLGFRFTTNENAGPYYGWMRVVFTGNTAGAIIEDWAYENDGSAIVAGRQNIPEPGPVALLCGGLMLLLGFRCRMTSENHVTSMRRESSMS